MGGQAAAGAGGLRSEGASAAGLGGEGSGEGRRGRRGVLGQKVFAEPLPSVRPRVSPAGCARRP